MADLNKIVDDLSALTVLEAAELSKLLEDKWGVSAAAAVAAAPAAAAAAGPRDGGVRRQGSLIFRLSYRTTIGAPSPQGV